MTPYSPENLDAAKPGPRHHRQRHPARESRSDGGARARHSTDELPRRVRLAGARGKAQRRRRRHARQDDDVGAHGARARLGGHRSDVPRRRRDAQLRRQLPQRQRAVRRGRGRRVRHGLLRQGPQVPALPREDGDAHERGVRPRRHLSRHGALRVGVREVRRDAFRTTASSPSAAAYPNAVAIARRAAKCVRGHLRRARRRRLHHREPDASVPRAHASSSASRAGTQATFLLPMSGHHNVENAVGVYAAARSLGLKADDRSARASRPSAA